MTSAGEPPSVASFARRRWPTTYRPQASHSCWMPIDLWDHGEIPEYCCMIYLVGPHSNASHVVWLNNDGKYISEMADENEFSAECCINWVYSLAVTRKYCLLINPQILISYWRRLVDNPGMSISWSTPHILATFPLPGYVQHSGCPAMLCLEFTVSWCCRQPTDSSEPTNLPWLVMMLHGCS